MVVVFWAVTPLQSGIFAVQGIHKTRDMSLVVSNSLLPLQEQAAALDVGFLNTGYGVLWLGQRIPSFTTRTSALAPFNSVQRDPPTGENKTWSAETTQYSADLTCRPANVTRKSIRTLFFDDVRDCTIREFAMDVNRASSSPNEIMFLTNYIADYNETRTGRKVSQTRTCLDENQGEFLAIWMNPGQGSDSLDAAIFTALFCEPLYYTQKVNATVSLPDYVAISISPLGPKSNLTDEFFNRTHFESILNTGSVPKSGDKMISFQDSLTDRRDISGISAVDQSSVLLNRSIIVPAANMVGFAVGSTHFASKDYLDSTKLQEAFRSAYQTLFAMAAQSIMQPPAIHPVSPHGIESYRVTGVVLIRTFTYLVQGFLALISAGTVLLLCFSWKRVSGLDFDPNSISLLMCLSRRSPQALNFFKSLDLSWTGTSKESMEHLSFQFQARESGSKPVLNMASSGFFEDSTNGLRIQESTPVSSTARSSSPTKTMRPGVLSPVLGFAFPTLLAGATITIIYLKIRISREDGIPLPSNNTLVKQILLNYLPTAFGTIVEPMWVVINRLTCIIQTFDELQRQHARASRSISLQYTSLPPQLMVFRALRARHFLLALLCFISILANLLTISLSGLFVIQDTIQVGTVNLTQTILPQLQPSSLSSTGPSGQFGAPLQFAISNISTNTSLPSWTTQKHFFIPVELPSAVSHRNPSTYLFETTGIGAGLQCSELRENRADFGYEFDLNADATQATFSVNYTGPGGQVSRCYAQNAFTDESVLTNPEDTQLYLLGSSNGTNAIELFAGAKAPFHNPSGVEKATCPNLVLAGWVRSNIVLETQTSINENGLSANVSSSSLKKTFIACKPTVFGGRFNIEVDHTGLVLNYSEKSSLGTTSLQENMSEITTATMFQLQPVTKNQYLPWHTDSFASDWVNYFIRELTRSTAILDPTSPVPEYSSTSDLVSQVYQRLFAITLSQNAEFLARSPKSIVVPALSNSKESKVFMSEAMFIISISILSLDLLAAIAVYGFRSKAYLPRMPTSIASILAYFAASHILGDLDGEDKDQDMAKLARLEDEGQRYGFGKYMGTDGKIHTGIESAPFVSPPDRQDSGFGGFKMFRRSTYRRESEV